MSDLIAALRREIDAVFVHQYDEPVRIRVTLASVPGTILLMPEDVPGPILMSVDRQPRRELRIHPLDWSPLVQQARKEHGRAGAGVTELWGIPVLVEDGCEPEEWT